MFPTKALLASVLGSLAIGCAADSNDSSQSWTQTLHVDFHKVALTNAFNPNPLMVASEDPSFASKTYVGGIDGFSFHWGHRYELRVHIDQPQTPMMDDDGRRYTLVNVLSDQVVPSGAEFEQQLLTEHVTGDATKGYTLFGEVAFGCASDAVCADLATQLANQRHGRFNTTFRLQDDPVTPLLLVQVSPWK